MPKTDDELNPVLHWAMIKRDLRQASDEVLAKHGVTWGDMDMLEAEAIAMLGTLDVLDTEFGTVQIIPDKAIQYRIRKSNQDTEPTMFKRRLKLTRKEQ